MPGITVRRGPLAQLRYGPDGSALIADAAGLLASGRGPELRSAYHRVLQPMTVVDGLFWARAELSTLDGFRVMSGFRRADLERLAAQFNEGLRAASSGRLVLAFQPCVDARARVDELLSQPHYVRDSRRGAVDRTVESALAIRYDPLWRAYATPAQRRVIAVLEQYLAQSKASLAQANARFVERELATFQGFFDSIESNPLTGPQRTACVVNEERNLVLAGAGTGKTSVMIGRAGYLIASQQARSEQILMLAYGRKAMEEMRERQDSRLGHLIEDETPKIKTFHALGLEIIGLAEGRRPDITPMAEDAQLFARFVDEQIESLCRDPEYRRMLVHYHGSERYPFRTPFDFDSRRVYDEYVRTNELMTLKGEAVKSFEEVVVANFLSAHGVDYEYERPYPVDTASPARRQYKPDFYLPAYDIYIEHFALDRKGHPPAHFGQAYADGVVWKRQVHQKNGTKLMETFSYLKKEGILESTLEAQLHAAGVELLRRPDEELLEELRVSTQFTYFAQLVSSFLTLFRESELTLADLRTRAAGSRDRSRHTLLLDLIEPILKRYENELAEHKQIDFADMIALATRHVADGRFASPYTHILVDEFQDISQPRMRLLAALLAQDPASTLFVVGDDWQAIYGFAGSDIAFTREFERRLGVAATTILDTTFRFNDQIGAVASRFIQENPEQLAKSIGSLVRVDGPAVSLVGLADTAEALRLCARAIDQCRAGAEKDKATVLVLSRYNFTHEDVARSPEVRKIKSDYPGLSLRFMSMHAAKGKEADYVVVVGLQSGRNGFPCQKPVDRFLAPLLPDVESFKYAEERRLFYVALTRARHRVYLVYDPDKPSAFVSELLDPEQPYAIVRDEFGSAAAAAAAVPVACPLCGDGTLVVRQGATGAFAACSNFPYCRHTGPVCTKCGSLVRISDGKASCSDAECATTVAICPKCGGQMVERKGPGGSRFLGCSNYGKDGCDYTERLPARV